MSEVEVGYQSKLLLVSKLEIEELPMLSLPPAAVVMVYLRARLSLSLPSLVVLLCPPLSWL